MKNKESNKHAIVLCHGYNGGPLFMTFVKRTLQKSGLFQQVLNLELYDSWYGLKIDSYSIVSPIIEVNENFEVDITKTLVEYAYKQITEQLDPDIDVLHFLGHSMGGLVIRSLLKAVIMPNPNDWLRKNNSPKIGTIVQLATPNQGTMVTNLRIVKWINQLKMAYYLHTLGLPKRTLHLLKHKINQLIGKDNDDDHDHEYEHKQHISQLDQMRPNSTFLNWLNSEPIYTKDIPHYILSGTKNSLIITDVAWREPPPALSFELNLVKTPSDKELLDHVDPKRKISEDEILEINLKHHHHIHNHTTPNDGVVSIEDAKLPGAIWVELGEFSKKISHNGILNWFLKSDHYQFVKNKVLEIYQKEIAKMDQMKIKNKK